MGRSNNIKASLLVHQEFQSALVRLGIWLFLLVYLGAAIWDEYYQIDIQHYIYLFSFNLILFIAILVSVIIRPDWESRRYFSLVADISATTLSIFMAGNVVSPLFLLYVWIFISYGTRFGKRLLKMASFLSIVAYVTLILAMDQLAGNIFEITFFLCMLVLLPFYQYSLLKKIRIARERAERSSKVKSIFLSNMTDELRTPLNGIWEQIHQLNNTGMSSGQRDHAESILSSTAALDLMIGGVLDFSRIETGDLKLELVPFRIRTLLLDVSTAIATETDAKGLELICQVDEEVPTVVLGDELRLRQVLFSLLSSVVGISEGGEIRIVASLPEGYVDSVLIEIESSNRGVFSESQPQILDTWKGPPVNARRDEDAGLGTMIAHNLVELMGGKITAKKVHGDGRLFQVWLSFDKSEQQDISVPSVAGKKALVYESNSSSREAIVEGCRQVGITAIPVQQVADLTSAIVDIESGGGVDLAIIADTPTGQDMARIASMFRDHLDVDFPILFLGYKRIGLGLEDMQYTAFLRKPFMPTGLAEAAFKALNNGYGGI